MCMSGGSSGIGFAEAVRRATANRAAQSGSTEVGPTNGFAPAEALTIGGTPRPVGIDTPGSVRTGLQISRT